MAVNINQVSLIFDYVRVLQREILLNKGKVVLCAFFVGFAVLASGLNYQESYETSTTLHADTQNIIKPLLGGQAAITKVQDQTKVVREVIYSPRILGQVVQQAKLVEEGASPIDIENQANVLRSTLTVAGVGKNYIKIIARGKDPGAVYRTVNAVSDVFIRDVAENRREESREAYEFINGQVKAYKAQLQRAEERLKEFKSANTEGNEKTAKNRIANLRAQIEEIKLDIDENSAAITILESELGKEAKYLNRQFKADVYRERLLRAQQNLENLRLLYTDTHPDVVAVKHQIKDMEKAMEELRTAKDDDDAPDQKHSSSVNPLYEELRSKLSEKKVDKRTKERRLSVTQGLLDEEYARLKRIAESQADLAELSRDYNVTKSIYEDMLARKEKARLSMTLDIEGQGVAYRVQEPAVYPLTPSGLKFFHFALIGPFLGLFVSLAILVVYIIFDPRLRFVRELETIQGVSILGVIPHVSTPLKQRFWSWDVLLLGLLTVVALIAYAGVSYAKLKGML